MTNDNPYQSPRSPSIPPPQLVDAERLSAKARLLLRRREQPGGPGYYWQTTGGYRYLVISAAFLMFIACLWVIQFQYAAVALAGFFAGRTVRDFGWIWKFSRDWHLTKELIDWEKVQRLADSPAAAKTISN